MDDPLIEVRNYEWKGYQPMIDYGAQRVAFLRFNEEMQPARADSMERHTESDEVFILTIGKGMFIMGGNRIEIDGIYPHLIQIGRIHNVKRNAQHTILLSHDASVVLMENRDTNRYNSEYANLLKNQRQVIKDIAKRERFQ